MRQRREGGFVTNQLVVTPLLTRASEAAQTLRRAGVATLIVLLLVPLLQLAAATGTSLREQLSTDALTPALTAGTGVAATAPLSYAGTGWAAISDGSAMAVAAAGGVFDLRTTSIGGTPVAAVEPVRDGELLTFDHGNVTEWWRTVDNGLEQGWTFDSAPVDSNGVLTVDVAVTGGFTAVSESPTSVRLVGDGQTLWYPRPCLMGCNRTRPDFDHVGRRRSHPRHG